MSTTLDHTGARHSRAAPDSRTPLLAQRINNHSSSVKARLEEAFTNWFGWEILAAIVSVLAFAGIVILLVVFDDSSLPDWPSIFTINTIISFLSTLSQISFMVIIGASISQAKWIWYRCRAAGPIYRSLAAMQEFDDASRGPWGAFVFLLHFRFSTFASLAAIVVILSLLFGPFVQQLVNYHDKLVAAHDRTASIVRAQRYLAPSYEGLKLPSVVDLSMKAAIYGGTFDARNQANARTEFQCSTGNCTFARFNSLAVCSSCVNITDLITETCDDSGCENRHLPSGLSIPIHGSHINTSTTNISSDLSGVEASVLQFASLFSKNDTTSGQARAWECALFYCVNVYDATVNGGNLNQNVSTSWRNDSASTSLNEDLIFNPPKSLIPDNSNVTSFYVDELAAKALSKFMSTSFSGSGTASNNASRSYFSSDIIHALFEADDLPSRIGNLATAMSNNVRQQNDSGSFPFEGTAFEGQTFLKVRWIWIIYPASTLFISVLCLGLTIKATSHGGLLVWKTSQAALIFHGRRLRLQDTDVTTSSAGSMNERATSLHVHLVETEEGNWSLEQKPS